MTNYRTLYESAPVGLWRSKISDGRFINANKKICEILGFKEFYDINRKSLNDFYDSTELQNMLNLLFETKEIKDYPITMYKKDGKEISVLVSAQLHRDQGYIEGTIKDITDEISLEAIIVPHIKKMSQLKNDIIQRLEVYQYSPLKTL